MVPKPPLVTREELEEMKKHIAKYNDEMGMVQTDVAVIKNKVASVEKTVDKLDARTWYIVVGIIITIGVSIASAVM